MIWYFTPYSTDKNLFNAIDSYMNLITNPNDWVCLLDGDTAFLLPDFGHQLQEYVNRYPETGIFTSYASRCHYSIQVPEGAQMNNTDIMFHRELAEKLHREQKNKIVDIDRRIAGHLMLIKRSTWTLIRHEVFRMVVRQEKRILGVDTKISNAVLKAGLKIRLMQSIYIFHYLRLKEGFNNDKHLLAKK